jgi:peptide/nickel transport system ATP-binding protein
VNQEDALQTNDLKGFYKGSFGTVYAVDGVSFSIKKEEILGLAGESGCGKSTLLRLLTGIIEPPLSYEGGEVTLSTKNGEEHSIWKMSPEELRKKVSGKLVSYMPQSSFDALNPSLRIWKIIADVLRERDNRKYSKNEIYKMTADHFSRLGLEENILNRYSFELSGGMRQRAIVAISTYSQPYLLLLDEPTSALDVRSQKLLVDLLSYLYEEKIVQTMVFSSHDITILRQICHRIIIMYAGKIVEIGDIESVINDPLHPYSQGLINALLPLEAWTRTSKLTGISGRPPDLTSSTQSCRFRPRCPQFSGACKDKEAPLIEVKPGHWASCWLCCKES